MSRVESRAHDGVSRAPNADANEPRDGARASDATTSGQHELTPHDVLLRGVRLRYLDAGRGDDTPVLLLHGLGESRLQWSALAAQLSRERRVIALDFPGFGDSEGPPPSRFAYSYEGLAEVMLDLVAALGLGRVALVGHSMGGGVAMVAAADRPEFVERLVLIAPSCYATPRTIVDRLVSMPMLGPAIFRRLLGPIALRRHVRDGDSAGPHEASFEMLRRSSSTATLEARVSRVRCPTLVIWGRGDRVAPWTHGQRLAREITGARLEVLDCGHAPEREQADAVAALIERFVTPIPLETPAVVRRARAKNRFG